MCAAGSMCQTPRWSVDRDAYMRLLHEEANLPRQQPPTDGGRHRQTALMFASTAQHAANKLETDPSPLQTICILSGAGVRD